MCCDNIFTNSLHYASPAHGGWGVLKAGQLIPESYHLFISPAACGRHGSLAAQMEGRRGTVSYLHLTEESIVSGDYEQEVLEAADLLIAMRTGRGLRPKVFSLFVSCIDDLLGTDLDAICEELGEKYPDIQFISCHMNPTTTDTGVPPAVNIQNKIYSVLQPTPETDTGVNIIGVLQELHPDMEIFEVLRRMGAQEVRHISDYDTYAGYQSMARSRLNIVVAPPGKYASRNMQQKLGIPFVMALTAFRPENITKTYGQIAQAMGAQCPDLTAYESAAENALKETARALGDIKIIVDGEAVNRPFEFARALIEAGFTVHSIYEQKLIPADEEDFQWVRENHPEIPIYQPQHPKMTTAKKTTEECVAVGYSAGYLSGARHVVDLGGQNGLYGYQGVVRLMEMIRKAAAEEADMKKMLQDTVLVI